MDLSIVSYSIKVEPCDTPLSGNVLASGDDAADRAAEAEVAERLRRGDQWAWCTVTTTARVQRGPSVFEGMSVLGGCSYADEEAFRACEYREDQEKEARSDLLAQLRRVADDAEAARALLGRLDGQSAPVARPMLGALTVQDDIEASLLRCGWRPHTEASIKVEVRNNGFKDEKTLDVAISRLVRV